MGCEADHSPLPCSDLSGNDLNRGSWECWSEGRRLKEGHIHEGRLSPGVCMVMRGANTVQVLVYVWLSWVGRCQCYCCSVVVSANCEAQKQG